MLVIPALYCYLAVRLRTGKVAQTKSAKVCVGNDDLEWRESDHSLKTELQAHHRTTSRRVLNGYSTLTTDGILHVV